VAADYFCPRCRRPIPTAAAQQSEWIECDYCGTETPRDELGLPALPAKSIAAAKPSVDDDGDDAPLARPPMEIDHEELIDMTAMVDIVFFLLIFFLVTSMGSLESSIAMPVPKTEDGRGAQASLEPQADANDSAVEVTISSNDEIRVEGVLVQDEADLLARLRELLRSPSRPNTLMVVGNGDASHAAAVLVLDAGHEVGFERIALAITAGDSSP
jgi:biopolymer transport protein ExbD